MGDTCLNIENDIITFHDTILWQLRDTCAKIGCKFQENISDDIIMYEGGRIFRKACESGWDGLVRELLDYHKPLINRQKRAEYDPTRTMAESKFFERDENGQIIRVRIDINEKDPETGQTALMMACRQRNYTPVRAMLKHKLMKVQVNAQDNDGATALIHAVNANIIDDEIMRLLLTLGNADVNISDDSGRTAISYLSERDDEFAISAMIVLMHTARKKLDVNIACFRGITPMMYACAAGNFDVVVKFLSRSDVDIKAKDNYGRSAFMLAVIENRKSIVSVFLKQKGNKSVLVNECANERDRFMTPLMYASVWEHRTILRMLLRQKELDVNATDINGRTALMLAARGDRPKAVELLLMHPETDYNRIDKTMQDVWGLADMSEQSRMILDILYPERFEFAKDQMHLWKTKLYKVWYLRLKTKANDEQIALSLQSKGYNLAKAYKLICGQNLPARYYRTTTNKEAFNQKVSQYRWSLAADNTMKDTQELKLDYGDDDDDDNDDNDAKQADYVTTSKNVVEEEQDNGDSAELLKKSFADQVSANVGALNTGSQVIDDIDHELIDDLVGELVDGDVKQDNDDDDDDDAEEMYAPKSPSAAKNKEGMTLYDLEKVEGMCYLFIFLKI